MRIVDALADVLLGAQCPGCRRASWKICRSCLDQLQTSPHQVRRMTEFPVLAANYYRPILSQAIPRYKDDGALHFERQLAKRLKVALEELDLPKHVKLVPVPSRAKAVRQRGFDHAKRLTKMAARSLGLEVKALLLRKDTTQDQQGLGAVERAQNIRGTMKSKIRDEAVVVVDDVLTTGSSLLEARRALEEAGNHVIGGVVLADADRENFAKFTHK